jgi:hypothetical protein
MYKIAVARKRDFSDRVRCESRRASIIGEREGTGVGTKRNGGRSRRRMVISEIVAATVTSLAATRSWEVWVVRQGHHV